MDSSSEPNQPMTYWVGSRPPVSNSKASTFLLNPANLYRETPDLHGTFDSVNMMEVDLGKHTNWKMLFDQALRLLKFEVASEMIVRFSESSNLTVFQFANFLSSRSDTAIEDFSQTLTADRVFIYRLKLKRLHSAPSFSTFDFGVITDGKRNANVIRFIESIEAAIFGHNIKVRVFVCGPLNLLPSLKSELFEVILLDGETRFDDKGWITRKKNLIVKNSSAENILIIHDRYVLPESFFDQMIEYGPDFGVIVPFQHTTTGLRFPDWVTLSSQWTWTPSHLMQRHEYNPNMYVNGGAMLAKRWILAEHPWDELLFWSQGEDVELTRRMQQAGIVPAYADSVSLEVIESRNGYIASFEKGNPAPDSTRLGGFAASLLRHKLVGVFVRSNIGQYLVASKLGKVLQSTNFGAWLGRRLMGHVSK